MNLSPFHGCLGCDGFTQTVGRTYCRECRIRKFREAHGPEWEPLAGSYIGPPRIAPQTVEQS